MSKADGRFVRTAIHASRVIRPGGNRTSFHPQRQLDQIRAEGYDALCLPGGRAPEYLRLNEKVLQMVRHFAEQDKPIAAICHALQILSAADVLRKTCTGYPAVGPEVKKRVPNGSILTSAGHVDGKLVTAPARPAHPEWIAKFLQVLGTKIEL